MVDVLGSFDTTFNDPPFTPVNIINFHPTMKCVHEWWRVIRMAPVEKPNNSKHILPPLHES